MDPPDIDKCLEFLLRILFLYQKLEEGWTITKNEDSFDLTKEIDNVSNNILFE